MSPIQRILPRGQHTREFSVMRKAGYPVKEYIQHCYQQLKPKKEQLLVFNNCNLSTLSIFLRLKYIDIPPFMTNPIILRFLKDLSSMFTDTYFNYQAAWWHCSSKVLSRKNNLYILHERIIFPTIANVHHELCLVLLYHLLHLHHQEDSQLIQENIVKTLFPTLLTFKVQVTTGKR